MAQQQGGAGATLAKQAEALLKRLRKWDTEFLCIGTKKESFNVPTPEEAVKRISANLEYFLVNYAIVAAMFVLVAIVVYPLLLVLVSIFSGLWYLVLSRPSNFKVQVGAVLLMKKQMQ